MNKVFEKATPEKPIFAKITYYNYSFNDEYNYREKVPVWRGLVACTGLKTVLVEENKFNCYEDVWTKFRVMETGERFSLNSNIKKSSGLTLSDDFFDLDEVVPYSEKLHQEYLDIMNSITVTVSLSDYSETPDKYDMYPEIEGTKQSFIVPDAHSLEEGYKWIIENHPAQLMGCSISTSSGDFSFYAVPCNEYEKGYYETRRNREKYAQKEAERLGCKLGIFDYSIADAILENNIERE